MDENSGGELGAFLAGFIIGGLVGAATAIILAPRSGAETRARIMASGDELRRSGSERADQYREMAHDASATYRQRTSGAVHNVQQRLHHESEEPETDLSRIVLDDGVSGPAAVEEEVETTPDNGEESSTPSADG